MKREELKALGLTDEQIDKIMAENGKDIEKHKNDATKAADDLKAANDQLKAANDQISAFKEMKPEDLKKAADDWKAKYDQAVADHTAETQQRLFDSALEKGLTEAKAKNVKTIVPLLDLKGLTYNEADGSLIGLKEQLEKIKADEKNGFLFDAEDGDEPPPTIVTGSENSTSGKPMSKLEAAMFKGAGYQPPKE